MDLLNIDPGTIFSFEEISNYCFAENIIEVAYYFLNIVGYNL